MNGNHTTAPLGRLEQAAAAVIGGLALVIALAGFAVSFDAVSDAVRPSFGRLAPLVPLAIDLGILVFSGVHLLLARLDMPMPALRFVPWTLTVATVWLNVEAGGTLLEKVAHGVMPGLWVVFIEITTHAVKVRVGLATGKRMERIRRSRWLLAPLSTAGLWRRMVLWEITDYRTALAAERDRLLARAALRQTYGPAWRFTAPLADRVRLRLGALTPAAVPAAAPVGAAVPSTGVVALFADERSPSQDRPVPDGQEEGEVGSDWLDPWRFAVPIRDGVVPGEGTEDHDCPTGVRSETADAAGDEPRTWSGDDALFALGRSVASQLAEEGVPLTRAALIAGIRRRGQRISTTRATELLRQLRTAVSTSPLRQAQEGRSCG